MSAHSIRRPHRLRNTLALGLGAIAVTGVALIGLGTFDGAPAPAADQTVAEPASTPLVAATPPTTTSAPAHRASASATVAATPRRATPTTTTHRPPTTTTPKKPHVVGSGYDPTDPSYQGADDPGTKAGRAPTSGEDQQAWGCQQGYIPASQC